MAASSFYTIDGLRVLTPENGEVRPLETPGCLPSTPAFSPDGKWIAFTCGTDNGSYVDLLSLKNGSSRHLHLVQGSGSVAWSADSQRIIFFRSIMDSNSQRSISTAAAPAIWNLLGLHFNQQSLRAAIALHM